MPAQAPPRPIIGINADFYAPKTGNAYTRLNVNYIDAIVLAGGIPLIIPPLKKENFAEIDTYLGMCSGLVMTGGLDLDPRRNSQMMTNAVQPMTSRREDSDRYIMGQAIERKLPLLAIGVGMQLLNVMNEGSLYLHLPAENIKAMQHFDSTGGAHMHMVDVETKTTLEDIFGAEELRVNSAHHQGINQLGKRLRVGARAPDGLIEAIETTDESWFCIGVQWHPECTTASALDRQIFDNLVQSAMKFADEPAAEYAMV